MLSIAILKASNMHSVSLSKSSSLSETLITPWNDAIWIGVILERSLYLFLIYFNNPKYASAAFSSNFISIKSAFRL